MSSVSKARSEINLKRLLQKCEEMVGKNDQDRIFDKYVEELQKKLTEIHSQKENTKEHAGYVARVNALVELKKPKKPTHKDLYNELFEMKNTPYYARKKAPKVTTITDATPVVTSEVAETPENIKREELFTKEAKQVIRNATQEDESQFEELINKNRKIQDGYTEEMATLAKTLKENSYNISNIITKDNKNLDLLDSKVSSNLSGVGAENEKLKLHIGTSCSWTLTYWFMMIVATFLFVMMYMFIKMTPKK